MVKDGDRKDIQTPSHPRRPRSQTEIGTITVQGLPCLPLPFPARRQLVVWLTDRRVSRQVW
jgi:hypothetical protein